MAAGPLDPAMQGPGALLGPCRKVHPGGVNVVIGILGTLGAAIVVLWAVGVVREAMRTRRRSPVSTESARPQVVAGCVEIVLDVESADSDNPAAERLADDASMKVFAADPDVRCVDVLARDASLLGRRERSRPSTPLPVRFRAHRPRTSRHAHPDLTGHLDEDEPFSLPPREEPIEVLPRTQGGPVRVLADRFDLSPTVLTALRHPDDAVHLVRAILEAAGIEAERDGDLIRVGEVAIVVLPPPASGPWVTREALNHAYVRIEESGAVRGMVIAFGLLEYEDVRHREFAAPHIAHVGPEAVQRMADAAALGGDPVSFALGAPIHEAPPAWVVRSIGAHGARVG
jgi:hypothetical protein